MKKEKEKTKHEKTEKHEPKKEAPVIYNAKQNEPARENFQFSRYGIKGKPTTHRDYIQPEAITVNDIYMLNPRTMYIHEDPNLARKNYASPAMKNYSQLPSSGSYNSGKKAA